MGHRREPAGSETDEAHLVQDKNRPGGQVLECRALHANYPVQPVVGVTKLRPGLVYSFFE